MKLTDMSKQTRIPVSSIFDIIRNFERKGIIKKHTTLVKFESFGYRTKAFISFAVHKKHRQEMLELLNNHRNVNSLYKINNGWDFMAETLFPGVKEIEEFLEDIEEKVPVKKKNVFYIIDELRKEAFMANPGTAELLRVDEI